MYIYSNSMFNKDKKVDLKLIKNCWKCLAVDNEAL